MSLQPEIHLLGDRAWLIEWLGLSPEQALASMMHAISIFEQLPLHGQRELVPGFQSLTIHLQSPSSVDLKDERSIRDRLTRFEPRVAEPSRLLEIPVCYEPALGGILKSWPLKGERIGSPSPRCMLRLSIAFSVLDSVLAFLICLGYPLSDHTTS